MPSFKSTVVIAAAILSVYSQSIDPNSVPLATRQSWCSSQTSSCPALCIQINATYSTINTCDANTLQFSCVCSNGLSPNSSQYSLTLPYFICTTFDDQCVAACGNDNTCASACRDDHPCGAQNPVRVNVTSTSSSAAASATGTGTGTAAGGSSASPTVFSGFGGTTTTAASSSKNAGTMILDVGASYGLAIVFAGILSGFALL